MKGERREEGRDATHPSPRRVIHQHSSDDRSQDRSKQRAGAKESQIRRALLKSRDLGDGLEGRAVDSGSSESSDGSTCVKEQKQKSVQNVRGE